MTAATRTCAATLPVVRPSVMKVCVKSTHVIRIATTSTAISPTAAKTSGVEAVMIVMIAGVSQSGIICWAQL